MPDWTDLKFWAACCWNSAWNVDPLPLSVPLRAALLDEDPPPDDELPPDGEDEELDEHAARVSAVATTATPIVATCCLRRCGISGSPYTS
jgi:hypothetical protein